MEGAQIPRSARVSLCHAAVECIAADAGVRLLHIKGHSLAAQLRRPGRESTDVDVLAHPGELTRLISRLHAHGFSAVDSFVTSSPFAHSTSFVHDQWGHLDLHRHLPGISLPPEEAFDRLWADRGSAVIAGHSVAVPSIDAQALVLLLHAARNPGDTHARSDVRFVWDTAPPERRDRVDALAVELGAELALAIAVGRDVSPYAGHRDFALWMAVTNPQGRVHEWRSRIKATPTLRGKGALAVRSVLPNRHSLAVRLHRPPTSTDLVLEVGRRIRVGLSEVLPRRTPR